MRLAPGWLLDGLREAAQAPAALRARVLQHPSGLIDLGAARVRRAEAEERRLEQLVIERWTGK